MKIDITNSEIDGYYVTLTGNYAIIHYIYQPNVNYGFS